MNWYYADNGQQRGPVAEAELDSLFASGSIRQDTLVWSEGMANWQPYSAVRPVQPRATTVGEPPPPPSTPSGAVCSQCGQTFPPSEVIRYGDTWVCANCKPAFVQRLREGGPIIGGTLNYAGFWLRFVAYFVDQLILGVVGGILGFVIGLSVGSNTPEAQIIIQSLSAAVGLVLGAAYTTWFLGKFGATPGKMACKIKVVTPEGNSITYGRALGRYFASILSGLICAIGYIIAAFDDEKRSLHDRICNTRVIKQP